MIVIGIETSCDDTGVAIYSEQHGLLANVLHSQIPTHAKHGGVVPELASREHIQKISPLLQAALTMAQSKLQNKLPIAQLKLTDIDAIAYTKGPGLIGALLVGNAFAKALGYAYNIPTIGINHMEGHLLAPLLETRKPTFPFVALLVSGGHTQLFKVNAINDYQMLGETLDDAVGEAFDKTAKLLGLGYPGGPKLEQLAKQGRPGQFEFPRPLANKPTLNFSFSGLKTAVLNTIIHQRKHLEQSREDSEQSHEHLRQPNAHLEQQIKADIALAFQQAAIDSLTNKAIAALTTTGLNQLVIAGGVSANLALRQQLTAKAKIHDFDTFYPRLEFCTDNGAMIAFAGYQRLLKLEQQLDNDLIIAPDPRWRLTSLHQNK